MRSILLMLCFIIPLSASSQEWEVGGFVGGSNYVGDLSQHRLVASESNFAFGGLVRYNLNTDFALKGNIYYGAISGSDANASTQEERVRNLHFRSTLLDIGLQIEYHLLGTRRTLGSFRMAPYLFGGLSIFRFNPQAEYNGIWYDLQPRGTEGQETTRYQHREKYALSQLAVPVGIGIKHSLSKQWNVGLEVGYRLTFTDYLDDVSTTYVEDDILRGTHEEIAVILSNRSGEYIENNNLDREPFGPGDQRGDPTRNDHYLFAGVTVTYLLFPPACPTF